jgi:hypothetical protein
MRTTLIIPVAVLVVAGAIGAVGVTMESASDDAPLAPIVVRAPEGSPPNPASTPTPAPGRQPSLPVPAGDHPPALLMDPEGVPAPPPAITRNVAPPPEVTRSTPTPITRAPAITRSTPTPITRAPAITRSVVPAPPPVFGGDDADGWGDDDFDGDD